MHGPRRKTDEEWLAIPWDELTTTGRRRVLLLQCKFRCEQCGFDKRRKDGHHILEIDHIDGNHKNYERSNLRVLCPCCHALTPNFRNYGRSSKEKTSTRFRRENKGYNEVSKLLRERRLAYLESFKRAVIETHASGEIDYTKFGWVQRLCEKLNDACPQAVGRRVRRYLPEFYVNNCFLRGKK